MTRFKVVFLLKELLKGNIPAGFGLSGVIFRRKLVVSVRPSGKLYHKPHRLCSAYSWVVAECVIARAKI